MGPVHLLIILWFSCSAVVAVVELHFEAPVLAASPVPDGQKPPVFITPAADGFVALGRPHTNRSVLLSPWNQVVISPGTQSTSLPCAHITALPIRMPCHCALAALQSHSSAERRGSGLHTAPMAALRLAQGCSCTRPALRGPRHRRTDRFTQAALRG